MTARPQFLQSQDQNIVLCSGRSTPSSMTDYVNRGLPPLPRQFQEQIKQKPKSNRSSGSTGSQVRVVGGEKHIKSIRAEEHRPALQSKSNSSPAVYPEVLPKPPKPPMSKSEQKILQLTGHDTRYDRTFQERSEFWDSSSSSGSVYSQLEEGGPWRRTIPSRSVTAPTPAESGSTYLMSATYTPRNKSPALSGRKAGTTPLTAEFGDIQPIPKFQRPITPLEVATGEVKVPPEFPGKAGAGPASRTYSTEPITLQSFINEKESRSSSQKRNLGPQYSHGMTDPKMSHLVPAPLTVQSKPNKDPKSPGRKRRSSLLTNARESMAWGIREIQGPVIRTKEAAKSENPAMGPPSPQDHAKKRIFKQISEAMNKRLSGGKASPTRTPTIIPNAARAPDGPSTPVVRRSGRMPSIDMIKVAQHGNERVKKSFHIKTSDERRRENLKKKIVVVGIID